MIKGTKVMDPSLLLPAVALKLWPASKTTEGHRMVPHVVRPSKKHSSGLNYEILQYLENAINSTWSEIEM